MSSNESIRGHKSHRIKGHKSSHKSSNEDGLARKRHARCPPMNPKNVMRGTQGILEYRDTNPQ